LPSTLSRPWRSAGVKSGSPGVCAQTADAIHSAAKKDTENLARNDAAISTSLIFSLFITILHNNIITQIAINS
jgi:hypothetical protein